MAYPLVKFKKQINEVFFLKPNDLGIDFLNFWFKKITFFLKNFPFLYLIPLSFFLSFLIYLFLGKYLVFLTSLLQYGF